MAKIKAKKRRRQTERPQERPPERSQARPKARASTPRQKKGRAERQRGSGGDAQPPAPEPIARRDASAPGSSGKRPRRRPSLKIELNLSQRDQGGAGRAPAAERPNAAAASRPPPVPSPTRRPSLKLDLSAKLAQRRSTSPSREVVVGELDGPTDDSCLALQSIDLIIDEAAGSPVSLSPATGPPPRSRRPQRQRRGEQRPPVPPPRRPPPPPRKPPSRAPVDPRERYRSEGEIARGGMGGVHAVMDQRLRRRVAMKTFDEADPGSPLRRRFIDEAQITGQLDHPNIVPIYELGLERTGRPSFFTMKLVKGRDLAGLIKQLGEDRLESRNLERLIQLVLKACEAVSFAHSHGVIHRDLKPANLMVGSHGQLYVMDWGLALLLTGEREPSEEEQSHAIGTPAYMAPEQAWARIEEIDERTDVYGLGGILYTVLTGTAPHAAGNSVRAVELARRGQVRPPQEVVPDLALPPELCRIALKALARRREDRYEQVIELRRELEQFLRGGGWLATRIYEPGQLIIEEGDEAHEAFIVVEGTCEVHRRVEGRSVLLKRMGPGEVFGETVFLTDKRRLASVVARDRVTLKVITRESLELELAGNSWMKAFITVLAERFREASRQVTIPPSED